MKTLIMVGYAETKKDTPYEKEADIWSLNEFGLDLPRVDIVFQMHNRQIINDNKKDNKHLKKLKEFKGKIYMQKKFEDIPNSIAYPIKKMRSKYGNMFASTMDYMIALAIENGYEKIELYGMDMALYSEYQRQRPTFMYFLGVAKAKGIEVWIHPDSGLITNENYAFEGDSFLEIEEIMHEIHDMRQYIFKCVEEINYTNGMLDAIDMTRKDFDKEKTILKLEESRKGLIALLNKLNTQKEELISKLSDVSKCNVIVNPPDLILTR